MNKSVGLQLVLYSLLLAGLSYFVHRLAPALALPTLIAGLVGSVLCAVWGVRVMGGSRSKALPLLTLVPVSFVMLSQVVTAWSGGDLGMPGKRLAASLITGLFVLSVGMLMRIAYAGMDFGGGSAGPSKNDNAATRGSGSATAQARGSNTRSRSLVLWLLISLAGSAAALAGEEKDPQTASARTEVQMAEKTRVDAMLTGDADTLERLWHEDFLQISPTGGVRTKASRVRAFRTKTVAYTFLTNERVEVRIKGNMAIVLGVAERKGKEGSRDIGGTFRFSRVWLKEDGRWQLVLHQLTRVAKD
jgi:ketosteroid isomerase-like protein